jgi:hypothetical protein
MPVSKRRRLAEPVRVHRWLCGCVRRVRALYVPKNVVHAEMCGSHAWRVDYNSARLAMGFEHLMDSINRTTQDAVVAGRYSR